MSETTSTSASRTSSAGTSMLAHPVHTVTETVRHVPGAGVVKGAVDGVLDTIGAVSPRARRVAAYAGAGLLGAAGLIEWPVAAAGAAVVWLTQPRPHEHDGATTGARPAARQTAKPAARTAAKPGAAAPARKRAAKSSAARPAKTARSGRTTKSSARGAAASRTSKPS